MSRLLYASTAWWELTTTKDKLNLERQQGKLIEMNHLPDRESTFEKKVQSAIENLFNEMISYEEHVLTSSYPHIYRLNGLVLVYSAHLLSIFNLRAICYFNIFVNY